MAETEDEVRAQMLAQQVEILQNLQRVARSVGSIALQLGALAEKLDQSDEITRGLMLTLLAETRGGSKGAQEALARVRRDSGDITDQFELPGGVGKIQLTRRSQRVVIAGMITAICTAAFHIVALIFGK